MDLTWRTRYAEALSPLPPGEIMLPDLDHAPRPDLRGQTLLVTGANGFLGQHVCRLAIQAGADVLALVRDPRQAEALQADAASTQAAGTLRVHPIRWQPGTHFEELVQQADAFVHAAGGGRMRTPDDLTRANVDTTRMLADAAKGTRTRRFVLVSSIAALGPSPDPDQPLTDDQIPRPRSGYGQAKRQAEQVVEDAAHLRALSLRLPALYGPLDDRLLPLFQWAARGWIPTAMPHARLSLLHVHDAARLCLAAVAAPLQLQGAMLADDGVPTTRQQLCRDIAHACGRTARIMPLPAGLLHGAATASLLWAKLRDQPALLTPDKLNDMLAAGWALQATRVHDLDWAPRVERVPGLQDAYRSYREAGWITA